MVFSKHWVLKIFLAISALATGCSPLTPSAPKLSTGQTSTEKTTALGDLTKGGTTGSGATTLNTSLSVSTVVISYDDFIERSFSSGSMTTLDDDQIDKLDSNGLIAIPSPGDVNGHESAQRHATVYFVMKDLEKDRIDTLAPAVKATLTPCGGSLSNTCGADLDWKVELKEPAETGDPTKETHRETLFTYLDSVVVVF